MHLTLHLTRTRHLTRTSHMNTSHNHNHNHKKKSYEYISITQSCGLTITRKYHNHTKKHLLTIKKSSNKIPHNLVVHGTEANCTSSPGLPCRATPLGLPAEAAPHVQASRPGPRAPPGRGCRAAPPGLPAEAAPRLQAGAASTSRPGPRTPPGRGCCATPPGLSAEAAPCRASRPLD